MLFPLIIKSLKSIRTLKSENERKTMREIPRKSDWLMARARELHKKVKKGRIAFADDEKVIYEAGRLSMEEEMKKRTKSKVEH